MKSQGKRFLTNRGDEGGSVRWYIVPEDGFLTDYQIIDSTLYITDCSKCIELEFSCSDHKAIVKRIAKVNELIQELTNFRTALQKAQSQIKPKTFQY